MARTGRPSGYNKEIAEEICDTVACTSLGLEDICKQNPHWPSARNIIRWRHKYEEFGQMYAHAKQQQIEACIEDIFKIIHDKSEDFYINEEGKRLPNPANINRSRLQVDTLKWFAAKLAPRIYGERNSVSVGPDGKTLLVQLQAEENT